MDSQTRVLVALLMLCVLLPQGAATTAPPVALRVYGGDDDTRGEFPYIVSFMRSTGERTCSGSLIADRWVLTAAHCVNNIKIKKFIRYGDFGELYNNTKTITRVVNMFPYPGLIKSDKDQVPYYLNDIGLAKTEMAIHKPVGALSATDYRSLIGYNVKIAGFGVTFRKPFYIHKLVEEDKTRVLKVGEGVVITCPKDFKRLFRPTICVARKCSKVQLARPGDSGGPLMYDGKIIGVVSGGFTEIQLQMWTPISPYTRWIQDTIANTID